MSPIHIHFENFVYFVLASKHQPRPRPFPSFLIITKSVSQSSQLSEVKLVTCQTIHCQPKQVSNI